MPEVRSPIKDFERGMHGCIAVSADYRDFDMGLRKLLRKIK